MFVTTSTGHLDTCVSDDSNALLFPCDSGKHLTDVRDAGWTKAVEAVGREGLRFHDLRHFAGTIASQVGGTVAETQRRLGHSTYKAAMRYQAALDERDHEIAKKLSKAAQPKKKAGGLLGCEDVVGLLRPVANLGT